MEHSLLVCVTDKFGCESQTYLNYIYIHTIRRSPPPLFTPAPLSIPLYVPLKHPEFNKRKGEECSFKMRTRAYLRPDSRGIRIFPPPNPVAEESKLSSQTVRTHASVQGGKNREGVYTEWLYYSKMTGILSVRGNFPVTVKHMNSDIHFFLY
ncbi:hypothetical protein, unlikely [Trypanosoma brucei gambiense DAL972]|uniref:Uncharacterized protein n=1 Tax=Trypanosoma brucei gambiense (strain MHOM/CI/86/DAL972) TaxID=679716 RepID=C9ZVV3_TRYB9|nr:hypothetical protein, unlikely [Trypanosoma brucei gambiense DAL972]CBH13541.1 hypothetical protein, unlikely [Trypanosoma brucei gambiense DAL972]|eukprot:XP_011775818.1 hypothetical protein, unlikely [Trypanosoma brucei gambiense DAL972]